MSPSFQADPVKIIECPRDAWQSMPLPIPTEVKAEYLNTLIRAGFRHIDAVSFVSPTAVPQMVDSEKVLALLERPADLEIIGIVVNQQGAKRALQSGAVNTLGFPYSVSPTFLARNQKQTQEQARRTLETIVALAGEGHLGVVAYISMAFGNPYGDPWCAEDVIAACHDLQAMGVTDVSLADTVGLATPANIRALLGRLNAERVHPGVHLHARRENAREKVRAAYQAGCRRLDMALGGQGGCPFAQDALVGNVATEDAIQELRELGANLPHFQSLEHLLPMGHAIADRFSVAS